MEAPGESATRRSRAAAPEREPSLIMETHLCMPQLESLFRDSAIDLRWHDRVPDTKMTDGLLVLDGDHRVIYCSHRVSALFGLGQNEILGQGLKEILQCQRLDEESPDFFGSLIGAINGGNREPIKTQLTLSRPQAMEFPVTVFTVVLGPDESITALLFEEAANYPQEVHQWATMIGILAHELHNPLTVIKAYSDLLFFESPLNSTQKKWMDNIRISIDRMAALGSGLVSTARKRSGEMTVNVDQLTVSESVARVVDDISFTVTNHRIAALIPPDLPPVTANRLWFEQVLRNLLDNAVKYSPLGGPVTVAARVEADGQRMVISVSDQGIGIALEDQARIFSPSERVTRRETEKIWGTGLGLFIVKELVNLMEGEVWIESELNGGSTFFFSLPCARYEMSSEPSVNP